MQKPTTSTPHDAVFKKFLGHPDTARDFLDTYLPASLHELCDLDTLKLEPGSFIEEDLRASYSDVLWSLKTRTGKGYIYALIEHQSSPDAHMAFRMMRYAIATMQKHLDAGHKTLPLVVPIYGAPVICPTRIFPETELIVLPAFSAADSSVMFPLVVSTFRLPA